MPRERALKSRSASTTRTAFVSTKADDPVRCESLGEFNVALLAEFTTDIVEIKHQPETFDLYISGKRTRYTPDLLIVRSCGSYSYIEVKDHRALSKPKTVARLAALKEFFRDRDETFRIMSDHEMRTSNVLLVNIKHLTRFRTRDISNLKKHLPSIIDRLPATLEQVQEALGYETCFGLIANQLLWCDLTEKWTSQSIIKPMGENVYAFLN